MREITDNEKELLAIIHSWLTREINKEEYLLKENYTSLETQKTPRYFLRQGCIEAFNETRKYIENLQQMKYL